MSELASGASTRRDVQEQVQRLLDERVASGAEDGVQAAVYRRGELVVDAVAGAADPATGRPVAPETLFYAASTGKGVTATVVHVLAEQGVLDYDTPIAELWPEFGAHGKERATVRDALTHSAGVPGLPADMTFERYRDWAGMCALIADSTPWWTPGERSGYHAVTFGFILGEVVRRATGAPISEVLAERVAGPLGIADELYFGVPEAAVDRLARFVDDPAGAAVFASLPDDFPLFRAGPRELVPSAALANRLDLMRADVPSWAVLSARAVARMYAALLDEVDGVRLVSPERLRAISTVATSGIDEMSGGPAAYGLGYAVGTVGQAPAAPSVFGMVGIGGSAAYADTATGVTVAVTKNRLDPTQIDTYLAVRDLAVGALT
jgi:CubicO group peptidase (beta-lactamase class C family)